MLNWIRRIIVWTLLLVLLAAGALAATYYSGVTIPLFHDLTPVTFQNWNRTARIRAEVDHDSSLARYGGRVHFMVDLQMPEAAGRLQAFLDGGRTEVVACGPQKLLLHSLKKGQVAIDRDLIRIRGTVDMELAGPVGLRDDWALSTAMRIGHDRTTVWADVVDLDIANVPRPMIRALLDRRSRFTYTRDEVLDIVARSMKPADAAILIAHRDALDMAFESVRPALRGDALVLDAVVSVDEGAAFDVLGDRLLAAAGDGASALADQIGPTRANAQLKLDDLRKQLEDKGKKVLEDVIEGKDPAELLKDPGKLLKDPQTALAVLLRGLPDCKVSF